MLGKIQIIKVIRIKEPIPVKIIQNKDFIKN